MTEDGLSTAGEAAEAAVVQAVLVSAKPHPGFWGALGCCALVMGCQFMAGMFVLVAWAAVNAAATGRPPTPESLQDGMPISLLLCVGTLSTLAAALGLVLLVYRRRAPRILSLRSATSVQWLVVLLAVVPLSVLSSEVSNWVTWLFPGFSWTGSMFAELSRESLLGGFMFGALIAAVGEELCFRGFIGRGLVARYGVLGGVLMTSLLFGLVHLEPAQASGAVMAGVALHLIYLSTRSLAAPIVLHALNNAMGFAALGLSEWISIPGYIPGEAGTLEFTPWPVSLTALGAVLSLALVLWQARTRFVLPDGQTWQPGYVTAEQPPAEVNARPQDGAPRLAAVIFAGAMQAIFLTALLASMRLD